MSQGGKRNEKTWWLVYCRISSDPSGRGIGVDRQESEIRRLVAREGGEVADVFTDDDVTAYEGSRKGQVDRPDYRRMLRTIETWDRGGRLVIGVLHPDRLHRDVRQTIDLIDLCRARAVVVHSAWSGSYDLTTPSGRKRLTDDATNAKFESEHRQERILAAMDRHAQDGKPGGGPRPFGYVRLYDAPDAQRRRIVGEVLHEEEAAIIREITGWLLDEHWSTADVLRELHARGVTTTQGNRMSHHGLKIMLTSGRIAGLRDHRTADGTLRQYPAAWPAIIPRERWAQLRVMLLDPVRGPQHRGKYLLSGKLKCGVPGCTRTLSAAQSVKGKKKFRCNPRDGDRVLDIPQIHLTLDYAGCENWVVGLVLDRIERDGLGAARTDAERARELREANAVDEAKVSRLVDLYVTADDADAADFGQATRRLRERIRQRNAELTAILGRAVEVDPATIRADWEADRLTFNFKRRLIDATIDYVTVSRAMRGKSFFDPTRLTITWR